MISHVFQCFQSPNFAPIKFLRLEQWQSADSMIRETKQQQPAWVAGGMLGEGEALANEKLCIRQQNYSNERKKKPTVFEDVVIIT